MVLEFSQQQIHLLDVVLAESADALRDEIVRTDKLELREELKSRLDQLLVIQRQVEARMHQEQPAL
ncbi:hypothetical protein D7Y27_04680 [Corallococcus sp. AB004]|uniref:hypothetical protein n=1 Tax=Corallococcus TaxID=83461 RepID=UPI000EA2007C|nr:MULTISPECIES: hypothetical protein [Corallococcus]RKI48566.1 hypothetical protein D7Y27_04680 [Corallococcus sp. AB004]NPC69666.1 hypothetical protein [Corallococcus exiguus]NPD26216.1 hypothetical protein [Corallococcus exiguus]NRD47721.1 hypothetical protein [Corallococcus exiguus]RKI01752.1 hypothetical protein D7Y04_14675 [Corallococcus sp. AB038B]